MTSQPEAKRGPLEPLIEKVLRGEISLELALQEARTPAVAQRLSFDYVRRLGAWALRAIQSDQAPVALCAARLVLAAADAMAAQPGRPDRDDLDDIQGEARSRFVEIAKIALAAVPDGRTFALARAAAQQLVDRAESSGDGRFRCWAHKLLGTLYLDPYTAGKPLHPVLYPTGLARWRERLAHELGALAAAQAEAEQPMPAVAEALQRAEAELRIAAQLAQGRERGRVVKALVQALRFQQRGLGRSIDEAECIALAREALQLLDPQEDAAAIDELQHYAALDGSGETPAAAAATGAPAEELGALQQAERLCRHASTLAASDPARALRELRDAEPLFARLRPEAREQRLVLMTSILSGSDRGAVPIERGRALAAADALSERARKEAWPPRRTAQALFALAAATTTTDDEGDGITILRRIGTVDAPFLAENGPAALYLMAMLHINHGAALTNAARGAEALPIYGAAIGWLLRLELVPTALDVLGRLVDVAQRGGAGVADATLLSLGPIALHIELVGGQRAAELLQEGYRAAHAAFAEDVNSEMVTVLSGLAKGHAYGTALRAGLRWDYRQDPEARARLDAIADLERGLSPQAVRSPQPLGNAVQSELALVSYIGSATPRPGAQPAEVLHNLRHAFDAYCQRALLTAAAGQQPALLFHGDIQAVLEPETVLLDVLLTERPRGRSVILTRVVTASGPPEVFVNEVGAAASALATIGGLQLRMHGLAPQAALLRAALQGDPESGEVEPALAGLSEVVFGASLWQRLARLRAEGKQHLLVAPHGPLHFVPFHLLGDSEGDLAARFTVTYLPNVALLLRRKGRAPSARQGAAVFGHTFRAGNPFGLPELPKVEQEVADIAAALGTHAAVDAGATRAAVLEALRTRRFVHLATHGLHSVEAAAFHALFLWPAPSATRRDDGRLYAYELLGEPLDGLEVLSLGSCSSALGRFDESDNLRGLPGTLLLAGARAILAALWPVTDAAARRFFPRFYTELKQGSSPRQAFARAQQATRADFPEARDWAPFCLVEG
ncbi:MAG: CHAT domain-containing protein [Polyangia bacterium]